MFPLRNVKTKLYLQLSLQNACVTQGYVLDVFS